MTYQASSKWRQQNIAIIYENIFTYISLLVENHVCFHSISLSGWCVSLEIYTVLMKTYNINIEYQIKFWYHSI